MGSNAITLEDARALDRSDPFPHRRQSFSLPDGVIYLDGNSLGALPLATPGIVADVVQDQWGRSLISSWNDHDWIGAPARIGDKIASLIGARPGEVIVADSTSVNLFKLLAALVQMNSDRGDIVTEKGNFPTDLHIADGVAKMFGKRLVSVPSNQMAEAIGPDTAAIVLCHVHYRTAFRHDIKSVTDLARAAGARVIWDLSHSIGAVPLDLHADGVELAVGCGYKYLNGGPGAPAFLHIAGDLQPEMISPIRGWMGHADPFAFDEAYVPAPGMDRFLAGTPPILSLAALEAGVDLMLGVDQQALFGKSQRLLQMFADLMAARCPDFALISPDRAEQRGSHISFAHPQASAIMNALIAQGVIGDFRAPDVLRFGLTPLYIRFEDIWQAVDILAGIMASGTWRLAQHAGIRRVT